MPKRMIVALAVALLPAIAACDLAMQELRAQARDEWSEAYELSAGGVVEIVNQNGSIDVRRGSGKGVSIRAERIAKAPHDEAAKELLKRIEIVETSTADRVRVETKRLTTSGLFGGSIEVRYHVEVPDGVRVVAETTNGQVDVDGVSAETTVKTTNGGIRASGLEGAVTATTTNGEIDIEVESASGDIEAETTNGGITVRVPDSMKADISAETTNGGIDVSGLKVENEDRPSRRRMTGRLNGGGARISLETTNGGITIRGR